MGKSLPDQEEVAKSREKEHEPLSSIEEVGACPGHGVSIDVLRVAEQAENPSDLQKTVLMTGVTLIG